MASYTGLPFQETSAGAMQNLANTITQLATARRNRLDYLNQQGIENQQRQQGLDIQKQNAGLAQQQFADTHELNQEALAEKKTQFGQIQKQLHLSTFSPSAEAFNSGDESTGSSDDGSNLGDLGNKPALPQVSPQPSVSAPKNKFDRSNISGGVPGTPSSSSPSSIPTGEDEYEYKPSPAGGSGMVRVKKAATTPATESAVSSPSVPSATTASSAAAAGDAGPSTDAAPFRTGTESNAEGNLKVAAQSTEGPDTAFEDLSLKTQKRIIKEYQQNAPDGVKISPAEAILAYRQQQVMRTGLSTPSGMYASELSRKDPVTGAEVKYSASPFGGAATLDMAGKILPIQKQINEDPNMQTARTAVTAYQKMVEQARMASTSEAPGVNDRTLAQLYMQTFAPNAKFNEASQELIGDTHNIPEGVQKYIARALTGQTLLPGHRHAILDAANANVAQAAQTAMESTAAGRNLAHMSGLPDKIIPSVPVVPPSNFKGDGSVPGSSEGPGAGAVKTISTEQEFRALPPNSKFIWGPTGKPGTKK